MAEESTRMSDPDPGNRSPDEIRRDIERTRTELHETVDAIERRLTPGELFDEFWGRMREGKGAGDMVREHPVPLALMGLGLGWLAIEKATGGPDEHDREGQHGTRQREDGPSVTWRADPALRSEEDDSAGRMERIRDKASSLKDSASDIGDRASDAASSAADRVSEAASRAGDRARDAAHRAQDRFERMRNEQPLAIGAVTFGLGLAAGLMAPTTRWEDEHLGPASDRVKDTARETASEVRDVASEVAGEVKEVAREARDSVDESARETEGSSIGERIGDAIDRAKETAMHAADEHDIGREGLRKRGREVAEHARDNVRDGSDEMRASDPASRGRSGRSGMGDIARTTEPRQGSNWSGTGRTDETRRPERGAPDDRPRR